ncbi:MAG: hypothetical protein V7672_01110 [Brevundimonas sp.]|uniref:hypothetical protein n=1 Tax=Brevundimonas sp. TaxID=1871086 RepID=UPI003002816F
MGLPFVTRPPTDAEMKLLNLMISTFTDGSGNQREADGSSRAGWRELERVFAEFLTGAMHHEDKHVFDVIAPDWHEPKTHYGISVKSKQLTGRRTPFERHPDATAYLEIANSPAKMWEGITSRTGLVSGHFERREEAQAIGDALLQTIAGWKTAAKGIYEAQNRGVELAIPNSIYLNVSWSPFNGDRRNLHLCSFPMTFPAVQWVYGSQRCLRGIDPRYPGVALFDWYALSGGQLKYYPRFTDSLFDAPIQRLERLGSMSIYQKAVQYFEADYADLAGELQPEQLALLDRLIVEL